MKLSMYLFFVFLMFSCINEKSEKEHSAKRTSKKNEVKIGRDEADVILGAFKIQVDASDPKCKYLSTLMSSQSLNKEIKSGNSEGQQTTTYLGQMNVHGESFHVFKQIYSIQFARERHGGSVLIFTNKKGASYYEMEMSENLPIDLKYGVFRFMANTDTIYMKIECLSDNDIVFRKVKTR